MRRRKPKIKVILITFLFLLLCSTAYAYLETSLSIKGSVMGNYNNDGYVIDPGSNPYLEINNLTVNSWTEGNQYKYQFRFKLKNIGNITYDNFKVILTFSSNITGVNIWDYEYSFDQQILNVIKGSTNFTPNYEVEVNFIPPKDTGPSSTSSSIIFFIFNLTLVCTSEICSVVIYSDNLKPSLTACSFSWSVL